MIKSTIANQTITGDTNISVDPKDINTLNQRSMKEEISLLQQIKNGDRNALEALVAANQSYVVCVAKRFQNNGLSLHELILKGNLGLIIAAEQFDETRGFTFVAYAIWSIRLSIIQGFVDDIKNNPIPLNKIGLITRGNTLFSNMEQYFHREPTVQEINGMLEFQIKIMREAILPTSHHITSESFKLK